MKPIDVAILTESRYLNPQNPNTYELNVLWEDDLLKKALERLDLTVVRIDWADTSFDWKSTRSAIFRTTWDYFDRIDEFNAFLARTENKTAFINSIAQVRWNMNKWYLQDLKDEGVKMVKTTYIQKGEQRSLRELLLDSDYGEAILKPVIAGAARHTYKIDLKTVSTYETVFSTLIAEEDLMLQPYQYSITKKGEISLIVIGGEFTHAILKKAKKGDFRVQDDFGGTVHPYEPSHIEIQFAEQVVRACKPIPAYARVDAMWDNEGDLAVSEVELIEPELWFREHKPAADKLARVVKNRIDQSADFY